MKVSVITTVYNEQDNVRRLLESLVNQTNKPDEIVVVDGYSTDNTFSILQEFASKYDFVNVFQIFGNIAKGRNEAIKRAEFKIIAQIDAGCVADKNWLERITKPFKDDSIGLVAGFYDMVAKTNLQKAVAPFHGVTKRKFDPRAYLPSGRSMAYRKSTWKAVDGYSEKLQWAGEDTLFNYEILKSGVKIVRVPSAYVYWEVPKTFKETLSKFYKYALGDAQTGIWWHPGKNLSTHNIKIISIYFRYIILFIFAFLGLFSSFYFYVMILYVTFYSFWSIWKHIEDVDTMAARLWVPIIQFSSDFAIMAGFAVGLQKRP